MGYTLTIGEACIHYDDEIVSIRAAETALDDAPAHCPFTKTGNSRSPSYSGWSSFAETAGITELFYGGGWSGRGYDPCSETFHRHTPLLSNHPGAQPICKADADYISDALATYRRRHPNVEPGFWDLCPSTYREIDNGKDPTLARLIWLDFWMRWAVENCNKPVFENT